MCNQTVDNYADALDYVPDCYKTQLMFIQAFDSNLYAMQFVAEYYNTQELCDKPVNAWFFLYLFLFLIDIRLKKCVIKLFLKILSL